MTKEEIFQQSGVTVDDGILLINDKTRVISVPESQHLFGVVSDEKVERKQFKCKKIVGDNIDLSTLQLRVNWMNANGEKDQYIVEDARVEGDDILFSWVLSRKLTMYNGNINFIVCAVKVDGLGEITNEWNTTIATGEILEGIDVDTPVVEQAELDIIAQLINVMKATSYNTISAINEEGKTQLDGLKTEGITQVNRVTSEGTTQVNRVATEGTTQKGLVKSEGDTQIQAVQNEGAVQTGLIVEEYNNAKGSIAQVGAQQAESINSVANEAKANVTAEGTAQVKAVKDEGAKQLESLSVRGINAELTKYFNLRRNGKVYSTKFYKYDTSQSPTGEKLNSNKGMVCEPSTDTVVGRDDYQQYGLFQHFTCNYKVNPDGFIEITALEGDKEFKKTGAVNVGEVTCSGWVGVEDFADSFIIHYSDKKSDKTPYPMKESVNPDGTVNAWMVHAKYLAVDIAGKPYSSAGECPANNNQLHGVNTSYNSQVAWHHKHGTQYAGLCECDMFYRKLMLFIKYATKNSQSVMQGCTGYNSQRVVSKAETGVKRVILTNSQANEYVVGSYISVGDNSDASKAPDRYYSTCHNIAYDVKILSIEDLGDGNSALNLELDAPITTTATTWVTNFHWRTGSTDCVQGSDGSPVSNTSGKCPCKIQGIEYSLGGYEVLGNAIMDIVEVNGVPMRDVYIAKNAADITTDITAIRQKYAKARTQMPFTNSSWNYISELDIDPELGTMTIKEAKASGSSTGYCDGLYTDAATSGQREFLCVGGLYNWSTAGLFCVFADLGLTNSYWYSLAGVSPNGCRGEYVA